MKLTNPESNKVRWSRFFLKSVKKTKGKRGKIVFMAFVILFFLFAAKFSSIIYSNYSTAFPRVVHSVMNIAKNTALTPYHYAVSLFHPLYTEDLEKVQFDIEFKEWQKIEKKAKDALELGVLISEDSDWVKGLFSSRDKDNYKVEMRLKGDKLDHLVLDKPSFRVKIKGDNAWNGMTTFSIQNPGARNFLGEWLLFQVERSENILTPRYDFVDATVNGRNIGVMAVEEFFTKEMIESMGRRESFILKYNEDYSWEDARRLAERLDIVNDSSFTSVQFDGFDFLTVPAEIEPFGLNKINEDSRQEELLKTGMGLMDAFRNEDLLFCDVFDCRQYSKYFAIQYLFGGEHGNSWINERFYYNPVTSLFEPVSYDNLAGNISRKTLSGTIKDAPTFIGQALKDSRFVPVYQEELDRVSQGEFIDGIFDTYKDDLERYQGFLWREYAYTNYEDFREILYFNAAEIRATLTATTPVHVRIEPKMVSDGVDEIEVGVKNFFPMALSIPSIEVNGEKYFSDKFFNCVSGEKIEEFVLEPTLFHEYSGYRSFCVSVPSSLLPEVFVDVKVLGTDIVNAVKAIQMSSVVPEDRVIEAGANIGSFSFLKVNEEEKKITVPKGNWSVSEDVIIPSGYTVFAEPGAILKLGEGVSIFSYSSFVFDGTEAEPVRIEATDIAKPWGIIGVFMGEKPSRLHNVLISGGSQHVDRNYNLTGGVTFFRNDVELDGVKITDMHGEDGLNIVESEFVLKDVVLARIFSDAFDSDFSKGVIDGMIFVDIGNDSIDVSGTVVDIRNVSINNCGDKGVSAGEKSTIALRDTTISNAFIGLASKDLSTLTVSGTKLFNTEINLAAYQKKSEFGPGSIVLETEQNIPEESVLLHEDSLIKVNGKVYKYNRDRKHDVFAELEEITANKE